MGLGEAVADSLLRFLDPPPEAVPVSHHFFPVSFTRRLASKRPGPHHMDLDKRRKSYLRSRGKDKKIQYILLKQYWWSYDVYVCSFWFYISHTVYVYTYVKITYKKDYTTKTVYFPNTDSSYTDVYSEWDCDLFLCLGQFESDHNRVFIYKMFKMILQYYHNFF